MTPLDARRRLDAFARLLTPRLAQKFAAATARIRSAVVLDALAAAIQAGNVEGALRLIFGTEQAAAALGSVGDAVRAAILTAGRSWARAAADDLAALPRAFGRLLPSRAIGRAPARRPRRGAPVRRRAPVHARRAPPGAGGRRAGRVGLPAGGRPRGRGRRRDAHDDRGAQPAGRRPAGPAGDRLRAARRRAPAAGPRRPRERRPRPAPAAPHARAAGRPARLAHRPGRGRRAGADAGAGRRQRPRVRSEPARPPGRGRGAHGGARRGAAGARPHVGTGRSGRHRRARHRDRGVVHPDRRARAARPSPDAPRPDHPRGLLPRSRPARERGSTRGKGNIQCRCVQLFRTHATRALALEYVRQGAGNSGEGLPAPVRRTTARDRGFRPALP